LPWGGKAHKLRPSSERQQNTGKARRPPGILDADGFPVLGPPSDEPEILTIAGRTRMFFPRTTLNDLAEELTQKLGRRVTNATGLTGEFDIGLYWSEDDAGPSLKQALQDQLGLRLVEKSGPLDFVIVDHIEKLPTAN
jgi:uncharacterized protein (TIGR03435 family)